MQILFTKNIPEFCPHSKLFINNAFQVDNQRINFAYYNCTQLRQTSTSPSWFPPCHRFANWHDHNGNQIFWFTPRPSHFAHGRAWWAPQCWRKWNFAAHSSSLGTTEFPLILVKTFALSTGLVILLKKLITGTPEGRLYCINETW